MHYSNCRPWFAGHNYIVWNCAGEGDIEPAVRLVGAPQLPGKNEVRGTMRKLLEGLSKFQDVVFPAHRQEFEKLAHNQSPEALFITCADSRVLPNLITQTNPGDLFIIRNVGNIVPPFGSHGGVSSGIEYAVMALGVKDIVVCGHTDCGAMMGVLAPEKLTEMPLVAEWLNYGEPARRVVKDAFPQLKGDERLPIITEQNVAAQLQNLMTHPCVAARVARGDLALHGWVYSIATGSVSICDPATHKFAPFQPQKTPAAATEARSVLAV